jgi:hypothetical protein
MNAAIEQLDEQLQCLNADARVAFRQHIRAQQHRRANNRRRQRFADAGCMAAQQVDLQRAQ